MSQARIAVLMAAYNAEDTIQSAVDSILASEIPIDLYIIDDGSNIPVSDVLIDMSSNVFIHRLKKNTGLPGALNAGLKIILDKDYDYVARFDADDYSYPERFRVQLEYMQAHPNVKALGCWVNALGEDPNKPMFVIRHPEKHKDIFKSMYF